MARQEQLYKRPKKRIVEEEPIEPVEPRDVGETALRVVRQIDEELNEV